VPDRFIVAGNAFRCGEYSFSGDQCYWMSALAIYHESTPGEASLNCRAAAKSPMTTSGTTATSCHNAGIVTEPRHL
jgi:hypothetical protein